MVPLPLPAPPPLQPGQVTPAPPTPHGHDTLYNSVRRGRYASGVNVVGLSCLIFAIIKRKGTKGDLK